MPLFNTENPKSTYRNDPEYVTDPQRRMQLALTGFKANGAHNTFGKIMRFITPLTPLAGTAARRLTKGTDAFDNVKQEQKNDIGIAGNMVSGIGRVAAGILTGNPGGVIGGIGQAAGTIAGQVGNNPVDFTDEQQVYSYATGGKIMPMLRVRTPIPTKKTEPFVPMKKMPGERSPVDILKDFGGDEDIFMIDKNTGKPVGEISYGEGVFDKAAYNTMKKLVGDPKKLGMFVAKEMATHDKTAVMDKGGELPGGGGSKKKEVIVTDPQSKRLQMYNDSMYLHNRSEQMARMWSDTTIDPQTLAKYGGNLVKAFTPPGVFDRLGAIEPTSVKSVQVPNSDDLLEIPIYPEPKEKVILQSRWKGGEIKKYDNGNEVIPGNPVEDYFLSQLERNRNTDMSPIPTPDIEGLQQLPQPELAMRQTGQSPVGVGFKMGADGSPLGGINFEDIFSAAKVGIGLAGASEKIPEYKAPDAWTEYLAEVTGRRDQGLSLQETTSYRSDIDNQYNADYTNILSLAGGNAATALGNLGSAGARRTNSRLKLAGINAEVARDNYSRYSDAVMKELGLDRMIFNDKRELAIENKNAASGLAAEGLQSIIDSAQYKKAYEEGSPYYRFMEYQNKESALLDKLLGSDVMKQFLSNYDK